MSQSDGLLCQIAGEKNDKKTKQRLVCMVFIVWVKDYTDLAGWTVEHYTDTSSADELAAIFVYLYGYTVQINSLLSGLCNVLHCWVNWQ